MLKKQSCENPEKLKNNSEMMKDEEIAEFDSDIAALLTSNADENEIRKDLEKFEEKNT